VDDEGRFLVHGEPVTHARTLQALWRGLRPADGGWEVRIGREVARVQVAETPFAVCAAVREGDRIVLWLPDGRREPLDPRTLRLGADGVLRCTLASGFAARFTRAAQVALAPCLEEDPGAPSGFRLALGGVGFPIRAA